MPKEGCAASRLMLEIFPHLLALPLYTGHPSHYCPVLALLLAIEKETQ